MISDYRLLIAGEVNGDQVVTTAWVRKLLESLQTANVLQQGYALVVKDLEQKVRDLEMCLYGNGSNGVVQKVEALASSEAPRATKKRRCTHCGEDHASTDCAIRASNHEADVQKMKEFKQKKEKIKKDRDLGIQRRMIKANLRAGIKVEPKLLELLKKKKVVAPSSFETWQKLKEKDLRRRFKQAEKDVNYLAEFSAQDLDQQAKVLEKYSQDTSMVFLSRVQIALAALDVGWENFKEMYAKRVIDQKRGNWQARLEPRKPREPSRPEVPAREYREPDLSKRTYKRNRTPSEDGRTKRLVQAAPANPAPVQTIIVNEPEQMMEEKRTETKRPLTLIRDEVQTQVQSQQPRSPQRPSVPAQRPTAPSSPGPRQQPPQSQHVDKRVVNEKAKATKKFRPTGPALYEQRHGKRSRIFESYPAQYDKAQQGVARQNQSRYHADQQQHYENQVYDQGEYYDNNEYQEEYDAEGYVVGEYGVGRYEANPEEYFKDY